MSNRIPSFFSHRNEDGTITLADQLGFIITREQWYVIREKVDAFYATATDEEIAAANAELESEYTPTTPQLKAPPKYKSGKGYIYLVHSESGHYKIGRASNVVTRYNAISTKIPFKTTLLYSVHLEDCYAAERFLHDRFADLRAEGEWFMLNDAHVEFITSGEWLKAFERYRG